MTTKERVGHTLGPWMVRQSAGDSHVVDVRPAGGPANIANVYACGGDILANAKLIAAAPDLLAACEAALDGYKRNFKQDGRWISCGIADEATLLESAIEKATS